MLYRESMLNGKVDGMINRRKCEGDTYGAGL